MPTHFALKSQQMSFGGGSAGRMRMQIYIQHNGGVAQPEINQQRLISDSSYQRRQRPYITDSMSPTTFVNKQPDLKQIKVYR